MICVLTRAPRPTCGAPRQLGDAKTAVTYFEKALGAPCGSPTEQDFGDWMLGEARKGLQLAREMLAEA